MPDWFQKSLFEVISELGQVPEFAEDCGHKVPGPVCKLDQETFVLLSRAFQSGQYGKGIIQGFMQVKDMTTPDDLQRAARAAHALRRSKGKHAVVMTLFQSELDA